MKASQTREVLRNWLACGAPLVETNGAKVAKSSTEGAAGDQYPACTSQVTLETLFKSTFSECGGCHNGTAIAPPPVFLSLDALAESLRTTSDCGGKSFVSPGEPEESYLLDLLKAPNPDCKHDRMPKGGDPMSDRAIKEVSDWIAAGAPTTAADLSELKEDGDDQPVSEEGTDTDEAASTGDEEDEDTASKDAGRSTTR
jgi:cytochrome c553